MLTLKRKKLALMILLALMGLGYFSTVSNLEINVFLKSYISVIPLQLLAILYVIYWHWKER